MIRIGAVTTSRADYYLLEILLNKIEADPAFDLSLFVCQGHTDKNRGNTIADINPKFKIDMVPTTGYKNRKANNKQIIKVITDSLNDLNSVYAAKLKNIDGIILLGDRYELLPFAIYCMINCIPIIHLGGGEDTFNAYDNCIRNYITQVASVHFTTNELYKSNVCRMLGSAKNVFNTGDMRITKIFELQHITKSQWLKTVGIQKSNKITLLTYHPVTLEESDPGFQMRTILDVFMSMNITTIVTAPNLDTGGDSIIDVIQEYQAKYPKSIVFKENMGHELYLQSMNFVTFLSGNSSSGMIEPAYFCLPTLNIGNRQEGRYRTENITDVSNKPQDIGSATRKILMDTEFKTRFKNPFFYGKNNPSDEIMVKIKEYFDAG